MRAVIHSKKHYVQMSRFTATANAEVDQVLIDSQGINFVDNVFEVTEGASVKAIYIELWALGSDNATTSIVALAKFPANLVPFTFAEMAAIGAVANKNNILFFHQGLGANDGVGQPVPIMRGWYKIPKSKQRFALADRMILQVACQGTGTMDFCGFALYKEYS